MVSVVGVVVKEGVVVIVVVGGGGVGVGGGGGGVVVVSGTKVVLVVVVTGIAAQSLPALHHRQWVFNPAAGRGLACHRHDADSTYNEVEAVHNKREHHEARHLCVRLRV